MKAFLITESYIRDIIRSSTVEDRIKDILVRGAIETSMSLPQFIYDVFSYFMPAYGTPELEHYPLTEVDQVKEVFHPYTRKFSMDTDTNVRVVDPFDALYNRSFPGQDTTFESDLMEVIYNNIEDAFGVEEANSSFCDVVQLLEYVVITLELSFINLSNRSDGTSIKVFLATSGNNITIFVH